MFKYIFLSVRIVRDFYFKSRRAIWDEQFGKLSRWKRSSKRAWKILLYKNIHRPIFCFREAAGQIRRARHSRCPKISPRAYSEITRGKSRVEVAPSVRRTVGNTRKFLVIILTASIDHFTHNGIKVQIKIRLNQKLNSESRIKIQRNSNDNFERIIDPISPPNDQFSHGTLCLCNHLITEAKQNIIHSTVHENSAKKKGKKTQIEPRQSRIDKGGKADNYGRARLA